MQDLESKSKVDRLEFIKHLLKNYDFSKKHCDSIGDKVSSKLGYKNGSDFKDKLLDSISKLENQKKGQIVV